MRSFRSKPTGWQYESSRHSLAAKGISTKVSVYSARKYPKSPVIGRSSNRTLAGSLRNVFAERERRLYSEPMRLEEKRRARLGAAGELAKRPLTSEERDQVEFQRGLVLMPARSQAGFFVEGQAAIRKRNEALNALEQLKAENEDALKGREGSVARARVKRLYREYDVSNSKLDKYGYPPPPHDDQVLAEWAKMVAKTKVKVRK